MALLEQLAASASGNADDSTRWRAHFESLARTLLHGQRLMVAGEAHRLREIEFYLHGDDHPDPFTHRSEAQRRSGHWYFHRAGASLADAYRGGSFKGLDLSFGPGRSHGGILIRSLSRERDGAFVNGSSLCVDHMLRSACLSSVAALDAAIAERSFDDASSPLALLPCAASTNTIYATARVGLTLKRASEHPSMPAYIARRYRFLTAPRAIKKGRAQLIVALHEAGNSAKQIRALTGSPTKTIEHYLAAYAAGCELDDASTFVGRSLDAAATCGLLGACAPDS